MAHFEYLIFLQVLSIFLPQKWTVQNSKSMMDTLWSVWETTWNHLCACWGWGGGVRLSLPNKNEFNLIWFSFIHFSGKRAGHKPWFESAHGWSKVVQCFHSSWCPCCTDHAACWFSHLLPFKGNELNTIKYYRCDGWSLVFWFDCAIGFIKSPTLCTPSFGCWVVESSVLKVDPIALGTNKGLNN